MSLDCPDLQRPMKQSSRDMAKPTIGSWRILKRVARYLVGVTSVVRKIGGVWMLGDHCSITWSAGQGSYALSSAEAELSGMVEAVTRAAGLLSLAKEVGFEELST
eukprot:1480035-Karenia_brevis.AAC.1